MSGEGVPTTLTVVLVMGTPGMSEIRPTMLPGAACGVSACDCGVAPAAARRT
jgi:hypothetical protein